METISSQSSYLTSIKHTFCRGQCPMQVCQVSASSALRFLKRRILKFIRKFTLYVARQPIKLSDLDKSRMKHGGLLNKHFCKKIQISPRTLRKCQFPLSHYKSMENISCHSNQCSYPIGKKTQLM